MPGLPTSRRQPWHPIASVIGCALAMTMLLSPRVRAQRSAADTLLPDNPNQQLFRGRDVTLLAGAVVVSGEISHFDTKIVHYTQSPSVLGDCVRLQLVNRMTKANETTLTAGAPAMSHASSLSPAPCSRYSTGYRLPLVA